MLEALAPGEPKRTRDPAKVIPWLVAALVVCHVIFGLIAVGYQTGKAWPIAFLWAGACAVVGAAVGFLFGIPRTLQSDQVVHAVKRARAVRASSKPTAAHTQDTPPEIAPVLPSREPGRAKDAGIAASSELGYELRVNTNLEQISDWLTKILVGVGLTQLGQVPERLQAAATQIATGLGSSDGMKALALALIVYFSFVGFLAGYLLTRLFLPRAFYLGDQPDGQ